MSADWNLCALLFSAGALLPAAPPGTVPTPGSAIKSFGKVPSELAEDGRGYGIKNWDDLEVYQEHFIAWRADPRLGVCVRARIVQALDVDIDDADEAARITKVVAGANGLLRGRAGSPRVLIPMYCEGVAGKCVFQYASNPAWRIELLAKGQQWLAQGVHPSGAAYELRNTQSAILRTNKRELFGLLESLGYEQVSEAKAPKKKPDAVVAAMRARGLVLDESPERVAVTCPWAHEHTSPATGTDSVYFRPHTRGHAEAQYKCLHSHCAARNIRDLTSFLGLDGFAESMAQPLAHRGKISKLTEALDLFAELPLAYDHFSDSATLRNKPMQDRDLLEFRADLSRRGAEVSRELARDAAMARAHAKGYDALRDWCNALEHDGEPRVDGFLTNYFKLENTPYHRAVGRYIWSALAVRAVATSPVQADMIPVFSGPEGVGKSRAIAALAPWPSACAEVDLTAKDDDIARSMRGVCVVELSELRGHTKRGDAEFKAWVTRETDAWVPKYQEFEVRRARRAVLFGSTNDETFLHASGANRRFLPVYTPAQIDVAGIRANMPQLWAEALVRFRSIEWKEANELAASVRDAARVLDAWESLDSLPQRLTTGEFLALIGVQLSQQTPRDLARASEALRRRGYVQRRHDGARVWELQQLVTK